MKRTILVCAGLIAFSCQHATPIANTQTSMPERMPSAASTFISALPESYTCAQATASNKGSANHPVMGEQYCMGDEEAEFQREGHIMQRLQEKLQAKTSGPALQRGFHGKHQGCLKGILTIQDHLSPRAKFGIFAAPTSYKILARFSNGVGFTQADDKPDMRGFAFKVLGRTADGRLSDGEPNVRTQDFVMTNHPTPVGKNSVEFMDFAQANVEGGIALAYFVLGHADTTGKTLGDILFHQPEMNSMATEPYWGGTAFRLGPDQAVKFILKPEASDNSYAVSRSDFNYLREELASRSRSEQIKYQLYVQYQKNANDTPVENPFKVWDKAKPQTERVGELRFFKQDFVSEEKQQYCERLSMSVWHNLKDHEPMGNLNRARRVIYSASASKRGGGVVPQEPTVADVEKVFGPFQDD